MDSEERKWQATYLSNFVCHLVGDKIPKPLFTATEQKNKHGGTIIKDKNRIRAKRVRPYSYSFRVSEDEKKLLDEKVKLSGLSLTEYLIRVLLDNPIVSISCGSEILAELKRQGNNLNQAIKNCYFGRNTEKELLSTNAECKKLYSKLSSAIGGE